MRGSYYTIAILCLTASALAADSTAKQAQTDPDVLLPSVAGFLLTGHVINSAGAGISGATLSEKQASTSADGSGIFRMVLLPGAHNLQVHAQGYDALSLPVSIVGDADMTIQLGTSSTATVVASLDESDASAQVHRPDDLLLNPGHPGTPVSLPGFPSETASGGVKAPQYFAPGVAGDHGEPIAQYIRIGDFLFPNNLPANAHGNGYADPNLLIPASIINVETDAGAFDVRHGNNAVNLAVAYDLAPRLEPFVQFSGDSHDYDFVTGWSPQNPHTGAWVGIEIAGGNGFLALPESRKQYKLNGERSFASGRHEITIFGAGYYGSSRLAGLVPIDIQVPGDTIDQSQADRTQTALLVANDTWQISDERRVQFSGFLRDYGLELKSDFGDGLIRQSESRTVRGGNISYEQNLNGISFITGMDWRQDAPRDAELARRAANGSFQPVTLNNFSIGEVAPYASVHGHLSRLFSYSLGLRRDEILFSNLDRLTPANSYHAHSAQTSPRATFSFHASHKAEIPNVSFSYGEAFHTNDPRIGEGTSRGTPIATSHAYQLLISESLAATQFRLTLSQTANSQELAKIDADTGLQQNVGPSLVRALTFSAQRHFSFGFLQASFARAQAKERLTGQDVPEAPRLIWDVSGTIFRLPARLRASGELEYVGRKPLGDGFTAVPVRDIRGSLTRSFASNSIEVGVYFLLASGYTGQTLESLQLPTEGVPTERVVGVRNQSFAGFNLTYHLWAKHD
jgi:hypothetical protein